MTTNERIEMYAPKFKTVADNIKKNSNAVRVFAEEKPSHLCPYMQFVRLDAMKKKDVPYNIEDNSIFVEFKIDHTCNKVEVFRTGHVYISDDDKQTDKYRYLCMKSMTAVLTDNGGKKFRRQKFSSVDDLVKKMNNYYNAVMAEVEKYTGGYPYKTKY